jgi:hypothetical protein
VLLLVLALAMPAVPALAQDAGAVISVDAPADGQTANLGQDVVFTGWAAHWGGPGTGIDRVVVLDAPLGAGGQQIAQAQYGLARADVGAQYGAAWTNSDFKAMWKATGSAGNRTFWVYAHSVADDGWTNKTVTIQLTQGVQGSSPSSTAGAQYGSQNSGMPYGGQYGMQSGMQYGNQNSGQYGAGLYGPGSPNGAVPLAPFSSGFYGNGNAYGGTSPFGMYGGGQFGSAAPYGAYGYGGSQFSGGYPSIGANCAGAYNPYGSGLPYAASYPSYGNYFVSSCSGAFPGTGLVVPGAVAPPLTVIVGSTTQNSVALSWTPSVTPGITGYQVSQSPNVAGPFIPSVVASSSMSGATVGGLLPNTTSFFQVSAIAGGVASPPSAVVSATTLI